MTGWTDEHRAAVEWLRSEAARLGVSIRDFAADAGIDLSEMLYGKARAGREREQAAKDYAAAIAAADRDAGVVRDGRRVPRRTPDRYLDGHDDHDRRIAAVAASAAREDRKPRARFTLAYSWAILRAVREHGGIASWVAATGQPTRTAQYRYNGARRTVLAWAEPYPALYATCVEQYPPLQRGRPKSATRPVMKGRAAHQPAPSPTPPRWSDEDASEDLLPAEHCAPSRRARAAGSRRRGASHHLSRCRGSNDDATPTPGRHARTPKGGRGDE